MTAGTVMVVEDNAVTRKVMRLLFEGEGFGVVEAPDGETALALAATEGLALIVQDLRLPDIDGFVLLERLRALPGLATLPIVAVTGSLPVRPPEAMRFTSVFIKPVKPSHIVRSLKALLESRPAPRRRALLAEDDAVQRKVLRLLLEQWGFIVSEARNGVEGLRLALADPPDVIVSDLLMPDMDGMRFGREVRRSPALASVPFVLVTSYHLDEVDRALAAQSGASAIVSRTSDMADLQHVLATLTPHVERVAVPVPSSTTQQISRLVGQVQREASVRDGAAVGRITYTGLLPFFQSLSGLPGDDDAAGIERTAEALLAGYLDASGASAGCVFLAGPHGLTFQCQVGYERARADDLATFFGRADLLDRALATQASIELPSPGLDGDDITDVLRRAGVPGILIMPLVSRGEHVGVLALSEPETGHRATVTARLRIAEAARGPIAQALALARSMTELVASRQAFRGITDSSSDGILVVDPEGRINYANPAAAQMFGSDPAELAGLPVGDLVIAIAEAPGWTARRSDGSPLAADVTLTSFCDRPGRVLQAYTVRDLSQRETLDRLALLANHDALTGLHNRRRFDEHLARRIAESIRYQNGGVLVLIDLDDFKAINDTHGHQAGDAVLVAVARVLGAHTRRSDFVARLGGDEFAVELPHIALGESVPIAEKILVAIREPTEWRERSLQVGASAGIAAYPDDGATAERLFDAADAALYRAKRAGRNRSCTTRSGKGGT